MKNSLPMASAEELKRFLTARANQYAELVRQKNELISDDKLEIWRLKKSLGKLSAKGGDKAKGKTRRIREEIAELRSHIANVKENRKRFALCAKCAKAELEGRKAKWPVFRLGRIGPICVSPGGKPPKVIKGRSFE